MTLARSNLASLIAQYHALIAAHNYEGAYVMFCERLDNPTLRGIGEISRLRVPLLEALFPDGIEKRPVLKDQKDQMKLIHALALTYISGAGLPGKAAKLYPLLIVLAHQTGSEDMLGISLGNYAKALRQTGQIRQGEEVARQGLFIQRKLGKTRHEALNLYRYGMGLAQRGVKEESEHILTQALNLFETPLVEQDQAMVTGFLAQRALWLGDVEGALTHALRTWQTADSLASNSTHLDLNGVFKVRTAAARIMGEIRMLQGELDEADTWISTGLATANLINMIEEMLPSLHAQTEIARRRQQFDLAQRSLQDTWDLAETGQYVLYHADSYIMLARLHEDNHDTDEAIAAAQTAYRMAWCDGPPFAYQRGLQDAQAILERLNGVIPAMPPFDESCWSPLIDIGY